jgi:hypothetical protein
MNNAPQKARDNHYVPQWYQRGFLLNGLNLLHYLDLNPDPKKLSDGRLIKMNDRSVRTPSQCFVQKDLYTTFFGQHINDQIEKRLFGIIDDTGARAVRAFINSDVAEWLRHFSNFFYYIDSQKIRTPKGLDWIKKHYLNLGQVELMVEMQAIKNMHCTIWSEGVREIVSAKNSDVKFILTDHPVAIFNKACPPESNECIYPDDPSIALKGTQTLFPLDMDHCLILTNYEYATNPEKQNPIEKRTNARFIRNSMVRTDAFIRSRFLSEEQVQTINLLLKKRARRYIASPNKDWLFPENHITTDWSEIYKVLLPPSKELYHFGGEIIAGYKDGSTYYQDAFGRTTPENKYLKKPSGKTQPGRNDFCGCGSGKKFKNCCLVKDEKLRPSWEVLSIRERNLAFYKGVNNILGLDKGKTWDDVRRELNNDHVKNIYELFGFLWPPDTDIFSLFPKPDNELRALYTGIVDPRVISKVALGLTPYFEEILIQQPFIHPYTVKPEFSPIQSPHQHKQQTLKSLLLLLTLMPFVDAGFVNFIPDPCYFDNHLHLQMLNMAEERTKKYDFEGKEDALLMDLAKEDMMRNIFLLSKEQKISQLTRMKPGLSEQEINKMLQYMETKNIDDPLTLLQDNVLSEQGGQFNIMNVAPNLEMSLFIAQITGSIVLTDRPFRWREIVDSQHEVAGKVSYLWKELSHLNSSLEYVVCNECGDSYRQREGSSFKEIRKAFKDIYIAVQNHEESTVLSILEQLKQELANAHEISRNRAIKESLNSFNVKMKWLIPRGGFVDNNVQRLLLTSGSEGHLNNVSMAIFVEQA